MLDDALLLEDVDAGHGRRARQRVSAVGEATGELTLAERVGDALADDHATERQIARVHALGEADEVGGDVPVLDGEPLAATTESRHHLVGDEHDAVLVAHGAHALEVAGRRNQDAVRAHDALEHDGRHGLRPLHHERVAQVLQRALRFLDVVLAVELRTIGVGAPELDDTGDAGLTGPTTRITGELDRTTGGSVIAAVGGEHLVAAGVQTRHSDGVLGGLGATVGEEDHVQIAGSTLDNETSRLAARVVGVDRGDGAQAGGLFLNGRHQLGVLVTDVDVHQLTGEVEVTLAALVPEPTALGTGHHDGADEALGRPRMEHVGAVVGEGVGGAGVEHGHVVSLFVTGASEQSAICDRTMIDASHSRSPWCVVSLLRSSAWAR